MDFNVLMEDMRIASANLRKESFNRKSLSTVYCSKTCKAIDKTASSNTDYENVITGLWVITAHLIEQIDHLSPVPGIQEVALRLFRECTKAVLNIQWQNLEEDSSLRQNFLVSLANLNAKLVKCNFNRFRLLESLTENPWTDPTLAKIMGGGAEDEEEKEEVRKYIENEDPVILQLRVDMMLKENCEEYALNLCNSCLTHPDLKSDLKLRKTQLTLLHKLGQTDRLQEECQKLSTQEALLIIRQLQAKANREICTVLAQTFMVQNWIRPSDQEANKELLKLWIKQQVRVDKEQDRFKESAWAIAKLSQSTEQIIFFIDVLREQCGGTYLQLYIDMCIFAINVDKGQMETSLRQGSLESAIARKSDMAAICGKLACLVHHASVKVARLCVLTAFSLMPSEETYESIGKFYDKEHSCCGTCTENANADPGTVNPATLYEVERLLNMLRPDYLCPESSLTSVQTLCKRYLQERVNSKNIFTSVPVTSTQVEGPGKKKANNSDSKTHNLFDAVSPHELSSSQVLLSKLRLQQIQSKNIKNVIYSQPPQPTSFTVAPPPRGWPNILQTTPKRPGNSSDVSAEQLGNIVKIDKQLSGNVKGSNPLSGQGKQGQHIQVLTPSQRSLLQQQPKSQVRLPQPSASNASRQQQSTFPEQISLLNRPNASRNNGATVTQSSNQQMKEATQGILNRQFKLNTEAPQKFLSLQQKIFPTSLNLSKVSKAGSQQPGAYRLPTVSTLLKPSQSLEQQHPTPKSSLPPSFSYQSGLSKKESSPHQTMPMKNCNVKTVSKQPVKFQTEHLRSLMQATALNLQSQQKQQVLSKQMAGAVVTVNQSAQGPLNTNLPKHKVQTGTCFEIAHQATIANLHNKLLPKASRLQQLQQHGRQDAEQLLQWQFSQASSYHQNQFVVSSNKNQQQQHVVSVMKSLTDSTQFQSQNNAAVSSGGVVQSDSVSSENQAALPSDELSGSIMGIDDTIIKELLQDSGIFSNTFPDIEVEDINKIQAGAPTRESPVVSSRIYSPSRQSTSKLLMLSNAPASDASSVRNNATILSTKKMSASVFAPSFDSKHTSSLLQYATIAKSESKAPHADTNTLNQRQFPEDLKPCVDTNLTLPPSITDSGSNLSIVEQLREKMRKEQIEGEVTMDSSNNATYRCIICSLAFGELEELREHVRNVCKPGLQSSSVYNNKIEQDRAKSAKAGLETTTVFQCLRCFELCISDAGIKQHRLTCKRVPTVPPDIKNATLKGKTSPSSSSSRSSTPKTPVPKKEVKDNSNRLPDMPLPFPYPSLNTKTVLESLSDTAGKSQASSQANSRSATTTVTTTTKTEVSKSSILGKDLHQATENSTQKDKSKPPPSPSYSEISGSGGSKFYRCKVCSQTLCSMESLYSHWKECFAKTHSGENKVAYKTFVYDDELEPGEIRPLFGRVLENVVNVIRSVAHGHAGNTDDFDSDAELSDYESLLDLKDPCKISQVSKKPYFPKGTYSIHPSILCANPQTTPQCITKFKSQPKPMTAPIPGQRKSYIENEDKMPTNVADSNPLSEETANQSKKGEDSDGLSLRKGEESQCAVSEVGIGHEEKQDPNRGTHLKLRDRNSLKPIQSFINESFVSPYCKVGLYKGSVSKRRMSTQGDKAAEISTHSEESEEENHICVACKKLCPNERILVQHYAGKHLQPYTMKSLADTTSFFCHLCQKTFTTFKHYMLHVPNHSAVIFQKMNHSSPRRGSASPWSRRLASSRGFIIRQHKAKKGKISPKLASALKSKKKAARSARDRLRRCLSKKSAIRPSPLSLVEDDSSSSGPLLTRSRRSLSLGASERPTPRNHLTRRCQSFVHSLPQSENDDSCPSSNPACSDEDYMASEDIDSDSSPSVPPCTRNRKRSGQNPENSDESKRRRYSLPSGDPSSSETKDKSLLPVVSVRRISEQEIEKYSKGPDLNTHSEEASIEACVTISRLDPQSTSSFQASFESYLMKSMDVFTKSKSMPKISSSSSTRSPVEFSAQEESNGSSDQISQTDTESSTVSYATDPSHETDIKEDEETKEILSSLTKRRCSVNLGQKLDVDTIQTLTESTIDENHHETRDANDILQIQSSLMNCAVRLERTELADKLLESVKEGVSAPCVTDSDGLDADKGEVTNNTEHDAVKNHTIEENVNFEQVKGSPETHHQVVSEVVTKQQETVFGDSDVQLSSLPSAGSFTGDNSVPASAELETDKVNVINETVSETPSFNDGKIADKIVDSKPDIILSDSLAETVLSIENETVKEVKVENSVESVEDDAKLEGPVSAYQSDALLIERSKYSISESMVQENSLVSVNDLEEEIVSDSQLLPNSPKEVVLKFQDEKPRVDRDRTELNSLETLSFEIQDENNVTNTQTLVISQTSSSAANEIIKTDEQNDPVKNVSSPALAADSTNSCTNNVLDIQKENPVYQTNNESLPESLSTEAVQVNEESGDFEIKAMESANEEVQGEIPENNNSENPAGLVIQTVQTVGQPLGVEEVESQTRERSADEVSERETLEHSKPDDVQNADSLIFIEDTHQIQSPANFSAGIETETSVNTEQKSDDVISNNEDFQSPIGNITSNENASETRLKANVCPNEEASEMQTFVNLRFNEEASEIQALGSISSSEEVVDVQLSGNMTSNEEALEKPSIGNSISDKEASEIVSLDFNNFTETQTSENISVVASEVAQELTVTDTVASDDQEKGLEIMNRTAVAKEMAQELTFSDTVIASENQEQGLEIMDKSDVPNDMAQELTITEAVIASDTQEKGLEIMDKTDVVTEMAQELTIPEAVIASNTQEKGLEIMDNTDVVTEMAQELTIPEAVIASDTQEKGLEVMDKTDVVTEMAQELTIPEAVITCDTQEKGLEIMDKTDVVTEMAQELTIPEAVIADTQEKGLEVMDKTDGVTEMAQELTIPEAVIASDTQEKGLDIMDRADVDSSCGGIDTKEEAALTTDDLPQTLDMSITSPEINALIEIRWDDTETEIKEGKVIQKISCPTEEEINHKNTKVSFMSPEKSPLLGTKEQSAADLANNVNNAKTSELLSDSSHKDLEMVTPTCILSLNDEASGVRDGEMKNEIIKASLSCHDSSGQHPDEVIENGHDTVKTDDSHSLKESENNAPTLGWDGGNYSRTSPSVTNNSNAFLCAEVEEVMKQKQTPLSEPVESNLTEEIMNQSFHRHDFVGQDKWSIKDLKHVKGQEIEVMENMLIVGGKGHQNEYMMEKQGLVHESNPIMALNVGDFNDCGKLPQPLATTLGEPLQENTSVTETLIHGMITGQENRPDQEIGHSCAFPDSQQEEATDADALFEPIEDIDLLPTDNQVFPEPAHSVTLKEAVMTPSETNDGCQSPEKLQNHLSEYDSEEAQVEPQSSAIQAERAKETEKGLRVEEENFRIDEDQQSTASDFQMIQSYKGEQLEIFSKEEDERIGKKSSSSLYETFAPSPVSEPPKDLLDTGKSKESIEAGETLEELDTVLEHSSSDVPSHAIENSTSEVKEQALWSYEIDLGVEQQSKEESVMKTEEQYGKVDSLTSVVVGESTTWNVEELEVEVEDVRKTDDSDHKNLHHLDEDDLSDYDLVIEEDTSYNKNVFNQALMIKDLKIEKSSKSVSLPNRKRNNSAIDQESISPTKRQYQKLSSGLKSLKERLKPHRFEWDDFDEGLSSKEIRVSSIENRRLLERKQNALKSKSESSPFMWDLEDSPEKQEQPCFENSALDSDIRKSLTFENVEEKALNVPAVVTNENPSKRGPKAQMVQVSNNRRGPVPKKHSSAIVKDKPNAKVRKHAKSASSLTSPASTQAASTRTGVRQRHRSSESPSVKTKSTEESPLLPPNVSSASDVIVDEEISFNTKSYSPIPPEVPKTKVPEVKSVTDETPKRRRRRSKKIDSLNSKMISSSTPEVKGVASDEKRGKLSNQNSVVSESLSLKRQERDLTPSSEAKRVKLSGQNKSIDPLTPKLKKAGLIRVTKHPSLSTPSPSADKVNVLPFTRSSEAALKAFNQKSLRNREVQPTKEQPSSSNSRTPQQKRSQENLKQNKNSLSHQPSATSSTRLMVGQGNSATSQLSRKISRQAGDRNEMPTAAVVKRRTPSLPRKNSKEMFTSHSKRKQSTPSTTIYRVDPLPKGVSSKSAATSAKAHGTVHTPLPPGVSVTSVNPKKKQAKAKWKIDKEMKPTKVKSKQHRSPISFRKT